MCLNCNSSVHVFIDLDTVNVTFFYKLMWKDVIGQICHFLVLHCQGYITYIDQQWTYLIQLTKLYSYYSIFLWSAHKPED